MLEAWRLQLRKSFMMRLSRLMPALLLAIFLLQAWGTVTYYGWSAVFQNVTILVVAVLLFGANLLQSLVLLPRRAKKIFGQQKAFGSEITFAWDQDGLRVTSDTGHSQLAWGDYVRWLEDDKTLVLFQSDAILNFLPKRLLTAEQAAEIRERLTAAIGKAGARRKKLKT
ncbi:YcxB family protein [Caulobacter sp. FWC2]|uniref:YcxB family protein n=1 Tax=Caulobacter sp. FWC2 TaxID=69664 RepID=UPI000C152CF1|nr:YcxB family protein [Caulobacter sp. FWC2]PIB90620.1 hypothetical protein CSW62_02975 [Caulobacter sp. FWC2]